MTTYVGIPEVKVGVGLPPFMVSSERGFYYDVESHRYLRHVVSVSGGRSSALMLLILLKNGILKSERGDVVVFNNTSAEHPETYKFLGRLKKYCESCGIPFFWLEFCTVVEMGRYANLRHVLKRTPDLRLVNSQPYHPETNPYGYRSRGEVFEEMISFIRKTPSIYHRDCTVNMKVELADRFITYLFNLERSGESVLPFRGGGEGLSIDMMYDQYKASLGQMSESVYKRMVRYLSQCPISRESQDLRDFSVWRSDRGVVEDVEYINFIGFRRDEEMRVSTKRNRVSDLNDIPYYPLHQFGIEKKDVREFWNNNNKMDLKLDNRLGNCVYCFMKHTKGILSVYSQLPIDSLSDDLVGTPVDIRWWSRIEETYRRYTGSDELGSGFFGATKLKEKYNSFENLIKIGRSSDWKQMREWDGSGDSVSCECTD